MFDIPTRPDVREVVVTAECISDGIPPLLILAAEPKQKKEA
jgi:ATP-dependent Clp protease ATP-binding subunit ClpX